MGGQPNYRGRFIVVQAANAWEIETQSPSLSAGSINLWLSLMLDGIEAKVIVMIVGAIICSYSCFKQLMAHSNGPLYIFATLGGNHFDTDNIGDVEMIEEFNLRQSITPPV